MAQHAGPPAPQDLTVAETAQDVMRQMRLHARGFPRVALGPFTAVFLAEGLVALAGGTQPALSLLAFAVTAVATAMFMVDCHRLTLLDDGPPTPRLMPDPRDWRYLGRSIMVAILVALGLMLPLIIFAPGLMALPGGFYILAIVASLLGLGGMLAIGLKLPATAIDRDMTIGASWDCTKRALPAILGLVIVLIAPIHVMTTMAALLSTVATLNDLPVVPPLLLSLAFQFAELALFATILSVIYRRRRGVDVKV